MSRVNYYQSAFNSQKEKLNILPEFYLLPFFKISILLVWPLLFFSGAIFCLSWPYLVEKEILKKGRNERCTSPPTPRPQNKQKSTRDWQKVRAVESKSCISGT